MARSKIALIVLMLWLLVSFSVAQAQYDAFAQGLLVYNVWVRPTAPTPADGATPEPPLPGTVSGVYMTIENTSSTDFKLVGVSDSIAEMTMLHEMTVDSKGVMRMHMIDSLDIPAGQTVKFDSNGYHAMLMNVSEDIYPGQAVPLTLTFESNYGTTSYASVASVAAIATDTPPPGDPIIVANAVARPLTDNHVNVWLILDNHGDQADKLTGVSSSLGGNAVLAHIIETGFMPLAPNTLDIPPHTLVMPGDGGFFIQLNNLTQPPGDAFLVTLTFESGKQITLAVPVQSGYDS